jgi:hypothetical protein
MNQFFINGVRLETESLRSLNEAYYENDETLKPLKNQKALLTIKTALASIRQNYLVYQLFYKKETATDYSYFFESIIDTLKSYLDYCELVLNTF